MGPIARRTLALATLGRKQNAFTLSRPPALKQGRIEGSAFPQPMVFSDETAIQ